MASTGLKERSERDGNECTKKRKIQILEKLERKERAGGKEQKFLSFSYFNSYFRKTEMRKQKKDEEVA